MSSWRSRWRRAFSAKLRPKAFSQRTESVPGWHSWLVLLQLPPGSDEDFLHNILGLGACGDNRCDDEAHRRLVASVTTR